MSGKPSWRFEEIDLTTIEVPEERLRSILSEQEQISMRGSIQHLGLIQEIGVRRVGDRILLVYGESRLKELLRQGVKKYLAKVWDVDDKTAILLEIAENTAQGGIDPIVLMNRIKVLKQDYNMTAKQIHEITGVSESVISKLSTILKMPTTVQTYVITGNLDYTKAYTLSKIQRPDLQEYYAEQAVLQEWTLEQTEKVVADVNKWLKELERKGEEVKAPLTVDVGRDTCDFCKEKLVQELIEYPGLCKVCKEKITRLLYMLEIFFGKKLKNIEYSMLEDIRIVKLG